MTIKIKLSISSYNELAAQLEKIGIKVDANLQSLTIEKGTEFEPPFDGRMATIRRDCADIAAKTYALEGGMSYVEYVNKIYEFVVSGKMPQNKNTLTIEKSTNWGEAIVNSDVTKT